MKLQHPYYQDPMVLLFSATLEPTEWEWVKEICTEISLDHMDEMEKFRKYCIVFKVCS